jgi:nucleoside-diphosphate-sugar epimerase
MSTERRKKTRQVLVTGATGFIGQHLVPLLLNNNYQVVATARDLNKALQFDWYKEVQFVVSDFHKESANISFEEGAGLIHLAWQGLPNYNSLFHFEENLPLNYRYIKSMVLRGISQVLVTGTCFEYGFQSGPLASNTRTFPNTPYGIAKDHLRQQLEFLTKENNFCFQWARLFYMHGKGQSPKSFISQLEEAIMNGDEVFNMSGGEQLRDYLPIQAVAQQLFDLYVSRRRGISNVCSGKPTSIRRLAEDRIKELGAQIRLNLGSRPYSDFEPMAFWGVRDVGETLYLPALPNAALETKEQAQSLAPMRLRINTHLNFLENEAFDGGLIDYSEGYENSQAHSVKFQMHMRSVLSLLKHNTKKGSLIVEVGCGKGDFVEMVQADGFAKIQGYDASYDGNNPVIEKRYINETDRIRADLVILRHVLEHIPNPYKFLSLLKVVFGDVKIYIEVPNYDWIVANKTFFDITYEHVNYFSQMSLKMLFDDTEIIHGLSFDDQYQYIIADLSALSAKFGSSYESNNWQHISIAELFPNLEYEIDRLNSVADGRTVYIWGGGTKGCLFLSHCASRNKLIDKVAYVVDQNPRKIGKYLPGSLIQIKSKEEFYKSINDDVLLIISNPAYKDEIVESIKTSGVVNDILIETL